MFRKGTLGLVLALTTAIASPAFAQEHRAEVTVTGGWTFSEGVTGESVLAGDGNVYDELVPKSAGRWPSRSAC